MSDRNSTDKLLKAGLGGTLSEASAECVDAEALAAWADRALSRSETARIDAHVAGCARCQAMAAAFAESGVDASLAPAASAPSWPLRWVLPISVAAAAVLIWAILPRRPLEAPAPVTVARVEPPATAAPAPPPPQAAPPSRAAANTTKAAPNPAQTRARQSPTPARRDDAAPSSPPGLPVSAAPVEAPKEIKPEPPPRMETVVNGMPAVFGPIPVEPSREAAGANPPRSMSSPPVPAASMPVARQAAAGSSRQQGITTDRIAALGSRNFLVEDAIEVVAQDPDPNGTGAVRWRARRGTGIERTTDAGATWRVVLQDPRLTIAAGSAPSRTVCWFVGPGGTVLKTDATGLLFQRVMNVPALDLMAVDAIDSLHATVRTVDSRTFVTADGGVTWTAR